MKRTAETIALMLWLLAYGPGHAEVTLDGSLGATGALSGPDYCITAEMGRVAGDNLFHSFGRFSVFGGESATFTGPDRIANVISRVTGGEVSVIDGLLRSEVGTADFYFINPAGVMFGPNARVDVPAAFHVGTAEQMRFMDGLVFSAVDMGGSTLSAASPESFGYLGGRGGDLVVSGSRLEFAPGSTVTMSGADVTVKGVDAEKASLLAPAGELRIAAIGDADAEISFSGNLASGAGTLEITLSAIETSGDGGGTLRMAAGAATVSNSTLAANNSGSANPAGGLDIAVAESLNVMHSKLQSNARADGNSGGVTVSATRLQIDGQADTESYNGIASRVVATAQGNAGPVSIEVAESISVENCGSISSSTWGAGNAGQMAITAGSLILDGKGRSRFTGIDSMSGPGSQGRGGRILLTVAGLTDIRNGGRILLGTASYGDAGDLALETDSLSIDGQGFTDWCTGISAGVFPGSNGHGGTIRIKAADWLELADGGAVDSGTWGAGDGGDILIVADRIKIDRQGGPIFTGINNTVGAEASGSSGQVTIVSNGLLELLNGGVVSTATFGAGDAGGISIDAGEMTIDDVREGNSFTGIFSPAETGSIGDAGQVALNVAGRLQIVGDGAQIDSSSTGAGSGGDIRVRAGRIDIDGLGDDDAITGIVSSAGSQSSGDAGNLYIQAGDLLAVVDGGRISTRSWGAGDAGDIAIEADDLSLTGGVIVDETGQRHVRTFISSEAGDGALGNSGNVSVKLSGMLEVLRGAELSSSSHGIGKAGEITVQATCIRIDSQDSEYDSSIASENWGKDTTNRAGGITLRANDLLDVRNGGEISTSSGVWSEGDAGDIVIEAARIQIDDGEIRSESSFAPGAGGTIRITASDHLDLLNGGEISTESWETAAGVVSILTDSLTLDGGEIRSGSHNGQAGALNISVCGHLEMTARGEISTSVSGEGDAGEVTVEAHSVRIENADISSDSFGMMDKAGKAGTVSITVADLLEVGDGGEISSNTFASGRAGNVIIDAGRLRIESRDDIAMIGSNSYDSREGRGGDAGSVGITVAGLLEVLSGSYISSSTFGAGDAGSVIIRADALLVDGFNAWGPSLIASRSVEDPAIAGYRITEGFAGNVEIEAGSLAVRNRGEISIASEQFVTGGLLSNPPEAHIRIQGQSVSLDRNASITARSTGGASAASILIHSGTVRLSGNSCIQTASVTTDGGPIRLQADVILLEESLITSSVESCGNGGDITVTGFSPARVLVLDGGFIQANAPAGARGGDIYIDAEALVASQGTLAVGGLERQSFLSGNGVNVIQAAAPGGEQGKIEITSPDLDISGALVNLDARLAVPLRLADDPCQAAFKAGASELVRVGPGGFAAYPEQHASVFMDEERIKRLLED